MNIRILAVALLVCPSWLLFPEATIAFSSVDEAVQFGLLNAKAYTYSYMQALTEMELARFQIRNLLPSLSVSLSNTDRMNYNAGDTRSKSIGLSLAQTVFDGGKARYQYELGKISSRFGYEEIKREIRAYQAQVISQYHELLMQEEFLQIEDELLRLAGEQLVIVQKEYEIGSILEVDFLDYKIQYAGIEMERDDYYRQYEKKKRDFAYLLGMEKPSFSLTGSVREDPSYSALSRYADAIADLTLGTSLEIRKKNLEQATSLASYKFLKQSLLPVVSLEGSVSFSGTAYPLYNPAYGIKLVIKFSDTRLPLSINTGVNFDSKNLTGTTSSAETAVLPSLGYGMSLNASKIAIQNGARELRELERTTWDAARDMVLDHDNAIRTLENQRKTLSLLEKKAYFSKIQTENGEITRVDYLNDLVSLSKKKMEVVSLGLQIQSTRHSIELALGLEFGYLDNFLLTIKESKHENEK